MSVSILEVSQDSFTTEEQSIPVSCLKYHSFACKSKVEVLEWLLEVKDRIN